MIVPPAIAYVADITTIEERAKGNSLLSAAMSFGFVIGPGFGGILAEYGTRVPLYAATGAAIAGVVFSIVCFPESLSKEQMKAARTKTPQKESFLKQYAKSLKSKYAMLFVLVLVMTFGLTNFESILGLYVTNRFQFSPQNIAMILTTGAVIGVGMQVLIVAKVIKMFGEKKVIKGSLLFTSSLMLYFYLPKTFGVSSL
ncbi:MFS transporter [Aneurinibacillus migulanus]|uniref:MFS transporter n=1 Tax=Aneurinibacillus migulanus TaxID=47500 RepID=UPI00209E035B|nr:MFS transporter [Aneurinibacillus migulanus]MCP1358928.1 MFS transporter [Aneurinibacillus migulanus]